MKLQKWALRLFFLLIILVGTSACSSMAHILWGQPNLVFAAGSCNPTRVPILNVHWFKDSSGAWRVVGEIVNKSDQVIESLQTGVETRTKYDRPADQGEEITVNTLNLEPGETAPFTAWIDRDIPNLDHFEVEVEGCVLAEENQRSQVSISSDQVVVDSAGRAEVTGEMVNPGTQTVLVNGLMAGVYDRKGNMISADYVQVMPRSLAPGESSAIRATLELPPGAGAAISSHKFFMDVLAADAAQPAAQVAGAALPLDPAQDVRILSHYTDAGGHFHLLGQVTNSSAKPVVTVVQAGVYSADKSKLLDAGQFTILLPLAPGQTLPFDISDWGTLNNLPKALAGADANIQVSLRLEPILSWNADTAAVKLPLDSSTVSITNGTAVFSGRVKNDTGSGISSGLVLMAVKQKADGKIVAVGNVRLAITDSFAPEEMMEYSLTLPLPAGLNADALQVEVTALGYQP